jgi:isopentenyl diphosphate isomerase/L-lactate dehydrogenase-like FMN-dependent dehydrogenase
LPEIVAAVAGRCKVLIDGGILRGTDVLKALALGADAVAIGRLAGMALAAGGAFAVNRMLELLEIEIRTNLALMGFSSIDQLTPGCLAAAEPVGLAHALSGFPLLNEGYPLAGRYTP